jgi:peptidoglycan/xylan/chitin deacetylase (PgdA/CDA1 family)
MKNIYSLIQKSIEWRLLLTKSSGRVLMFHKVDEIQNREFEDISITYKSFIYLMESLIERGHNFISLQELDAENQLDPGSIALTFDDGFDCLHRFVAPYLIDKNIPFAIFATTNLLNKPHYLTNGQLKFLSGSNLCTVGAHSVNHLLLRKLDNERSKSEISDSKIILEDLLLKEVAYFAYPYGSVYAVSGRDINYAKEAGYKLAFSSVKGSLSRQSLKERWFIPRVNVVEKNYSSIIRL